MDEGHTSYGRPESDIYSFGMVVWELADGTGAQPWEGQSVMNILLSVQAGRRPPLPERTPPVISCLIQSCWHGNPSHRPTARALVKSLLAMQPSCKNRPAELSREESCGLLDTCKGDIAPIRPDSSRVPLSEEGFADSDGTGWVIFDDGESDHEKGNDVVDAKISPRDTVEVVGENSQNANGVRGSAGSASEHELGLLTMGPFVHMEGTSLQGAVGEEESSSLLASTSRSVPIEDMSYSAAKDNAGRSMSEKGTATSALNFAQRANWEAADWELAVQHVAKLVAEGPEERRRLWECGAVEAVVSILGAAVPKIASDTDHPAADEKGNQLLRKTAAAALALLAASSAEDRAGLRRVGAVNVLVAAVQHGPRAVVASALSAIWSLAAGGEEDREAVRAAGGLSVLTAKAAGQGGAGRDLRVLAAAALLSAAADRPAQLAAAGAAAALAAVLLRAYAVPRTAATASPRQSRAAASPAGAARGEQRRRTRPRARAAALEAVAMTISALLRGLAATTSTNHGNTDIVSCSTCLPCSGDRNGEDGIYFGCGGGRLLYEVVEALVGRLLCAAGPRDSAEAARARPLSGPDVTVARLDSEPSRMRSGYAALAGAEAAALALWDLSWACPPVQAVARRCGAVTALVRLLEAGSDQWGLLRAVAGALWNIIADCQKNQAAAVSAGAIGTLVRIIADAATDGYDGGQAAAEAAAEAAGCLEILVISGTAERDAALLAGVVPALSKMLSGAACDRRACAATRLAVLLGSLLGGSQAESPVAWLPPRSPADPDNSSAATISAAAAAALSAGAGVALTQMMQHGATQDERLAGARALACVAATAARDAWPLAERAAAAAASLRASASDGGAWQVRRWAVAAVAWLDDG